MGGVVKTYLSHHSALGYWREHFPLDSELGLPARVTGTESCSSRRSDVRGSIPEEFIIEGRPVDVLVFSEGERRRSKDVTCHVWKTALPENSFYRARGEFVSSPEFTFLLMASELPIEQLIALGCELCGLYVLLPKGVTHPGALDEMPKRTSPLTNTSKISEFLERVGKANGKAKAQRALKYVVDGSRSPMETMVYMLLCLPAKLGGYGLPKPEMNATIQLDEEARAIAQRRHCEGDLCWPNTRPPLDIEYHGEVHVGASQMKSDVGRELGIEHMGWRVMTVTSSQVFDADRFEVVAVDAAVVIGKRLRPAAFDATQQRTRLRHELHRWMFEEQK